MLDMAAVVMAKKGMPVSEVILQQKAEFDRLGGLIFALRHSKTVVFSASQANVFMDSGTVYSDTLDHRLPFDSTFIQFESPVRFMSHFDGEIHDDPIVAIALGQLESSADIMFAEINKVPQGVTLPDRAFRRANQLIKDARDNGGTTVSNVAFVIYQDKAISSTLWTSTGFDESTFWMASDDPSMAIRSIVQASIRKLAISCVGFINCDNVHLHLEAQDERVNRKRAAKGKRVLEPYYTCRIDGVQYDKSGSEVGTGSQHGFRYDVRGHFRRLENKTIWVRPHQRGLAHELYIPKTYDARGKRAPA